MPRRPWRHRRRRRCRRGRPSAPRLLRALRAPRASSGTWGTLLAVPLYFTGHTPPRRAAAVVAGDALALAVRPQLAGPDHCSPPCRPPVDDLDHDVLLPPLPAIATPLESRPPAAGALVGVRALRHPDPGSSSSSAAPAACTACSPKWWARQDGAPGGTAPPGGRGRGRRSASDLCDGHAPRAASCSRRRTRRSRSSAVRPTRRAARTMRRPRLGVWLLIVVLTASSSSSSSLRPASAGSAATSSARRSCRSSSTSSSSPSRTLASAAKPPSTTHAFLGSKPLRRFADISVAVYVVHQTLIVYMTLAAYGVLSGAFATDGALILMPKWGAAAAAALDRPRLAAHLRLRAADGPAIRRCVSAPAATRQAGV